jgi:hypothetical protein
MWNRAKYFTIILDFNIKSDKMSIFKPMLFQGRGRKDRYFEGWYFKQVSENLDHVFSFIPGISLSEKESHSFIQVIDGVTGQSWNCSFPLSDFSSPANKFKLKVGRSEFSDEGISIHIDRDNLQCSGKIAFSGIVKYPSSFFSPGIMGWYSFVPFMECKHGVGSLLHTLSGELTINGKTFDFTGGKGYIEKDWGVSFPESWIWIHCNTFERENCSFMFSVAKIPWLGKYFMGHICYFYLDGTVHTFATYSGSSITKMELIGQSVEIDVENKTHLLKIKAVGKNLGLLKAPVTGKMNRMIKESIDADVEVLIFEKKTSKETFISGKRAGLEIIEKILDYFK